MTAAILAFTDYTEPFLLETDASKDGLEAVLLQKEADGQYHPISYGSRALTPHENNYHSTKLEFLALKWAVTEHFKEYLPYQPFLVKTDNNPLTCIMTTPNLDAIGHRWVGVLVWFNSELEYQKGCDNSGRCTELSYHSTGPWHEIIPWWSSIGISAFGQSPWPQPHCSQGWLLHRARGMCHHRPCTCTNAYHWLGWSSERGPNVECSVGLAEGGEEDRFEGTSGRTQLQWRKLVDLTELAEFYNSSGSPIPMLNAQRWDWRPSTLHSPLGLLCHHFEWVP